MIIANPIYDAVFKYLLEDKEIARELLSTILDEEIIALEIQPQETITETSTNSISIFRLDFIAIIKTKSNEQKKVLIELQKAKQLFDVMRFRRYLGENYRKEDEIKNDNATVESIPLPIITIYFLGFKLPNVEVPILKVNRVYKDVVTGKVLEIKEQFIELLSHDSYTIQIPRLKMNMKTRIERVLQVFSQDFKTDDKHKLNFVGDLNDPLVQKIVDKLIRAIASDEMRLQMDIEDEIERIFDREIRKKLMEQESKFIEKLEEKDKALGEKDKALEEKDKALEEKDKALEEKDKELEEKDKELEELRKALEKLKKK